MSQPVATRRDPFANFNFLVRMDGLTYGGFRECTGLSSTVAVIEYRDGGVPHSRKAPGRNSYGNITLRRGITADLDLYEWHTRALEGNIERRSGSIVLMDSAREPAVVWNFFDAWPTRMTAPSLNAEGAEIAIEEFELVVERLVRDK